MNKQRADRRTARRLRHWTRRGASVSLALLVLAVLAAVARGPQATAGADVPNPAPSAAPTVEVPSVEAPEVGVPDVEAPEVAAPEAPEVAVPEVEAPEVNLAPSAGVEPPSAGPEPRSAGADPAAGADEPPSGAPGPDSGSPPAVAPTPSGARHGAGARNVGGPSARPAGVAADQSAGRTMRSLHARRETRSLRRAVRRHLTCVTELFPLERVVLMLRAGLERGSPRSRGQVAHRTELAFPLVEAIEARGLKHLRDLGRSGCEAGAPTSAAAIYGQGPASLASSSFSAADLAAAGLPPQLRLSFTSASADDPGSGAGRVPPAVVSLGGGGEPVDDPMLEAALLAGLAIAVLLLGLLAQAISDRRRARRTRFEGSSGPA